MPITYVRYVHRKPIPDPIPAGFEELEQEETILFFDPVAEATVTTVGELYRRLDHGLRASETVIFRGDDLSFVEALERDPVLPDVLSDKRILALVGKGEPGRAAPSLIPVGEYPRPDKAFSLDMLREVELTAILQRSEAIFQDSEYHFELPSGMHAEKFVRLGDAFRSIFDVRRTADWILPYLTGDTVVIADTGSMLPLVMDIREQARERFGYHVEISTLDQYPQDAVAVADAVTAICNRPRVAQAKDAGKEQSILFLISVNSSGRLCRLFRALDRPYSRIVVVCDTGKDGSTANSPPDASLVRLPVTQWDIGADGKCAECRHSSVIRVHRETYELLPSIMREPVKLDAKAAESLKWFWEIADEAKAVELCVDVGYLDQHGQHDYRHFSVFLKTPELARHPRFRSHCIKLIRDEADEPGLIIIPRHENSGMVADFCHEAYPKSRIIEVPQGRFSDETQAAIRGVDRILVADDAIVTGYTLRNLRTEIFRVTQLLEMNPEVNVFVLVSRPSTDEPRLSIGRKFSNNKQLRKIVSGVHLYLPGARECPWCDEHRLLTSYRHRLTEPSLRIAEARIKKLEDPTMTPQLLLVGPGDHLPVDPKTHGSFFGTLDQQTAFAAGVAAAQAIKLKLGSLGGGIRAKVFDLPLAIHAYYEGVLLASILRTLSAVDVKNPPSDNLVQQEVIAINQAQAYPGVIAELALAAIDSKIPSKEFRKKLELWKSADPWLAMLTEIMDIVQPM